MPEQPTYRFFSEKLPVSPEFKLVVACSWLPEADHAVRQNYLVESLAKSELNWNMVVYLVLRHGVVGQFCTVMGKRGWADVPSEAKARLKASRTQQVVRSLGQVAELARIGRLFTEAGIPIIPLKGVALSQELYGDPGLRSAVDLDVLVQSEDLEAAEEILVGSGYHHAFGFRSMGERQKRHIINSFHHHEYTHDARGVHVELHWRSFSWSNGQVAALWEKSSRSTWLDAGFMRLSPEDNILFLADHGARHDWLSLKWLADIAMLMENLPEGKWLSIYNRAACFDLQRVVCQTATLLDFFYGIESPQLCRDLYNKDVVVQRLSAQAASQLLATGEQTAPQPRQFAGTRQAMRIKRLKPATSLSELLRGVVINHIDFIEFPLPNALFWLYLPLRPFLWLKRHYLSNAKHGRTV